MSESWRLNALKSVWCKNREWNTPYMEKVLPILERAAAYAEDHWNDYSEESTRVVRASNDALMALEREYYPENTEEFMN